MVGCADCSPSPMVAGSDTSFRRILWIALVANFAMFLFEVVASLVGDSLSLQADALDFFGDSANYLISLLVLGMSLAHRAYAALFKSVTMALFGSWVIGSALYRAFTYSAPDAVVMSGTAVLALAVNVAVAVLLYRYRGGDSNRRSIWLCSRNDAIGNVAVMLAAAGVFASNSRWPDLAVAVLIATLNVRAAVQVTRLALAELGTIRLKCDSRSENLMGSRVA
ncbi:MAG: cation transporter [Gammaproteobacteria bacterium]